MSLTSASPPRPSTRRYRRAAALAVGAALALTLAGCGSGSGGGSSSGSGASNTQFIQGTGEITTVPQGKRPAAPDISGTTVDGKHLALSDFPGKIIVLNVWGSWCDPCRAEAPNLAAVAKQTAGKGVQFIGINIRDESTAQSKGFDRDFGITYPSFFDPDGKLLLSFPRGSFSPQSIPNTLILDRHHKVAVRALKALTTGELTQALDPIIAEK